MEEARVNGFMLGTFEDGGETISRAVFGNTVVDLRTVVPGIERIGDLFAGWDAHLDTLESIDPAAAGARPVEELKVLPPVQPVGTIIAAGANYREHVLQMSVAHKLGKEGADATQLAADAAPKSMSAAARATPTSGPGSPRRSAAPTMTCSCRMSAARRLGTGTRRGHRPQGAPGLGRRRLRLRGRIHDRQRHHGAHARTAQRHRDDGHRLVPGEEPADLLSTGPYVVPKRFIPDPAKLESA